MATKVHRATAPACGCSAEAASRGEEQDQANVPRESSGEVKLEDLIPIATVIAAGCEPCAKLMVERALEQGSSRRDIMKVLGIVAHMQKLDCLAASVGKDVLARMEKPLAMAKKTLQSATS